MEIKQLVLEKVRAYQEDIIRDIFELVAVDSVKTEAQEGKPFGEGPAEALVKAEAVAKRLGFKTPISTTTWSTPIPEKARSESGS
jgi:succinyl-diaminopimelate desuccinylase